MRTVLYSFFLVLTCYQEALGQQSCDTLHWKPDLKLKWLDFKGNPDATTDVKARTSSDMSYSSILWNDTLKVLTQADFVQCQSWTKSGTENLLQHEQTHFDITEYSRRMFISKLSEKDFTEQNVSELLDKAYQESVQLRIEMDREYDTQTDHSRNLDAQRCWTKNIKAKLDALKFFSKKQTFIVLNRSSHTHRSTQ